MRCSASDLHGSCLKSKNKKIMKAIFGGVFRKSFVTSIGNISHFLIFVNSIFKVFRIL